MPPAALCTSVVSCLLSHVCVILVVGRLDWLCPLDGLKNTVTVFGRVSAVSGGGVLVPVR